MRGKGRFRVRLLVAMAGLWIGPLSAAAQVATLARGGITKESNLTLFPVATSPAEADSLFGANGFEAVTSVGLTFSAGDGAFYSEFLSDNLAVFAKLGYGRVGFGALVQSKDVSEDSGAGETDVVAETASERFLAAGGNGVIYYAVPVAAYGAGFNEQDKTVQAQLMLSPRLGLDIPSLSAGTSAFNGNLDLGMTLSTQLLSHRGVFNFFGTLRAGWVAWASDEFYANLGRESGFAYGSIEGGVILQDLIRIGVKGAFAGPRELLDAAPFSVSVQLVPITTK